MSHDHHHHSHPSEPAWKHDGVQVIPGNKLDPNTAQTPGMDRKAAITFARTGAQKLWAGTVTIHPDAKTGAHHHGHLESVIYVVKGRARMRWGEKLEFVAEAGRPVKELGSLPVGADGYVRKAYAAEAIATIPAQSRDVSAVVRVGQRVVARDVAVVDVAADAIYQFDLRVDQIG